MSGQMIRCTDCGETFENPKLAYVFHPEVDASERWAACPYCGGTDLELVKRCPVCGENFISRDEVVCHDCEEYLTTELKYLIYNHFDEDNQKGIALLFPEIGLD